jgi:C4-dicarboxylate-specific signal transduction histidine kinase
MRIAGEILDNRKMAEITVNDRDFYVNMYDWNQLKKWNLQNSSNIPEDSIFYNKKFDFFTEYKWYLVGIFLFLIFQTLLLIKLIRLNRNQKNIARKKEGAELLYRHLVKEDRMMKMGELTAALAHELNQPLTAILFNAQAGVRFLDSGKLTPGLSKEIYENIIEDDKRAGEIISSIRSLMKLEVREKENLDMVSVIHESVKIFQPEALQKNIALKIDIPSEQYYVKGDKIQLQQVLLNLYNNAANAVENNKEWNRLLEIGLQKKNEFVLISVKDNGPGIGKDMMENLFKPFVTGRKDGFGIGLSVCKSIIENHDGEIVAANSTDGGAELIIKLKINDTE